MTARRWLCAVGACAMVAMSCRSAPVGGADDGATVARDTVRGVLSVVGAEPLTALLLTSASAGAAVAIEGSQAAVMRGLSRLEVSVMGRQTSRRSSSSPVSNVFEADTFVVRASDRVIAYDGIVVSDRGEFYLVSGTSRVRVAHLPAALRDRLGARVYLVGPLDRAPIAYGAIR